MTSSSSWRPATAEDAPSRGGPQHIPRPPGARPGRDPAWAHLSAADREITLDRIDGALRGRVGRPARIEPIGRPSAVLAPVYADSGGTPHLILTRRAWHLRSHRGEVSFPGGRCEAGEDSITAALREADEEIALDPALVDVVGELDHLTTVTRRSYIVPIVGFLPERPELRANPDEVDGILHVPVAELLAPEVFREEQWRFGPVTRPLYFFELYGDTVWGATAHMITQFLTIVLGVGDRPIDDWR